MPDRSQGITNKEMNSYFNINKITDIVKRPDLPVDEIITTYDPINSIPMKDSAWFPCPVCAGMIRIHRRMKQQDRQCDACQNVFDFLKKGDGGFKYRISDKKPNTKRSQINVEAMIGHMRKRR